jgi:GAF domain-containing protein
VISVLRRRITARLLAIEAGVALTIASVAIAVTPRHRLIGWLGDPQPARPTPERQEVAALVAAADAATITQIRAGRAVGTMVTRVAALLPWHPTCLRQALAVRWMLRRRSTPNVVHLGIADVASMDAHAWVTVHDVTVVGRRARPFIAVAAFDG